MFGQQIASAELGGKVVGWSPDGTRLATESFDGIAFWDRELRARGRLAVPAHRVISWSPDWRRLAVGHKIDGTLSIWDATAGRRQVQLKPGLGTGIHGMRHVAWSPDGLVLAAVNGGLRFWSTDVRTGWIHKLTSGVPLKALPRPPRGPDSQFQWALAWAPDSATAATTDTSGQIRLWKPGVSTRPSAVWEPLGGSHRQSIAWSPNGRLLATSGDPSGVVRLLDPESGNVVQELDGHTGGSDAVIWSPSNGRVVTLCSGDNSLRLWDLGAGRIVDSVSGGDGRITAVAWSPVGDLLAFSIADRTVVLDMSNPRPNAGAADEFVERERYGSHVEESPRDRVFISYRRADALAEAHWLHASLVEAYGPERVFIDVDDVPIAAEVSSALRESIGLAGAMLAIIGPEWEASEWIEFEIAEALDQGVPIVPVLVRRNGMPAADSIPESIASILGLNAATLHPVSWKHDLDRLLPAVSSLIDR